MVHYPLAKSKTQSNIQTDVKKAYKYNYNRQNKI